MRAQLHPNYANRRKLQQQYVLHFDFVCMCVCMYVWVTIKICQTSNDIYVSLLLAFQMH